MANYNGWTNYNTWRVNLEIFDGWDSDYLSASEAEEIAHTYYLDDIVDVSPLAAGLVESFLDDVNWHEIAAAHTEQEA